MGAAVHPQLPQCGELEPWLATGHEANDDSTEFTLTLREGVMWSDGEAFDADDVVFTVEMAMQNEELTAREVATIRSQVASVEKVDDLTVLFTLTAPNPRFVVENFGVRTFGSFLIMPEHVWSAAEDSATFAFYPPIGTGPYTFGSAASNRAIWDRNDDWWGARTGFMDLPEPERVIFLESGGEESRAQLMATNQLDAAQNLSVGTFEAIRARTLHNGLVCRLLPMPRCRSMARQLGDQSRCRTLGLDDWAALWLLSSSARRVVNFAAEGAANAIGRTMCGAPYVARGALHRRCGRGRLSGLFGHEADVAARAGRDRGRRMVFVKTATTYQEGRRDVAVAIHVNSASTGIYPIPSTWWSSSFSGAGHRRAFHSGGEFGVLGRSPSIRRLRDPSYSWLPAGP